MFSILERLRGGWLDILLWCVSGVGGEVGRGSSVFTHTHTLLSKVGWLVVLGFKAL